jgi:Spy/CpxP family protein refolding chaperone
MIVKPQICKLLLAASLLVNAGLIAAAWLPGWRDASPAEVERAHFGMSHERVAEHLRLDAAQRERWHALEAGFVASLQASGRDIRRHRERLVAALMSPGAQPPDAAAIERERAAIFELQQAQQRLVIRQLLEERELLRAEQRAALSELLLSQGVPGGGR